MGVIRKTAKFVKVVAFVGGAALVAIFFSNTMASADGLFTVHEENGVCRDISTYAIGLASGSGTMVVPQGPGPVVAAYLEWVGADDETPNLVTTRPAADSTLLVNGSEVVGVQANGAAGAAELHPGEWWFSWSTDIGPDTYDLMNHDGDTTLEISGWDTDELHERNRNGALLTVIHDTSPCTDPVNIEVLSGVDFFYSGFGKPVSSTIVAPVTPSEHPSIANVVLSHWGTDSRIGLCRTMALWSLSGSGAEPAPQDLPLITVDENNGEASSANGSVEILQNPFFNPEATCVQEINPTPDAPYEPGHPYPGGATGSPYRLLTVTPDDGGYVGPQTSLIELELLVPPGTTWVAFQLESEGLNIGESGAWGGGFRVLSRPAAGLGDRVWLDEDNNGIQDAGEVGVPGVAVRLLDPTDLTVQKQTTTDDDGIYLFAGDPGCYLIDFDLPDGYSFSPSTAGDDDTIDSNVVTSTADYGRTAEVCVDLDGYDDTIDAGIVPPPPTSVGDRVWYDNNDNGLQDEGEAGVPNVLAQLVDAEGDVIARTRTDDDGYYGFHDLRPGQYRVNFRVPPGLIVASTTTGGNDELDSDASTELFTSKGPKEPKEHNDNRDGTKQPPSAALLETAQLEAAEDADSDLWIGTRWIQAEGGVDYTNLDAGLLVLQQQTTTTTEPSTTTTTEPSTTVSTTIGSSTTASTAPTTTAAPTTTTEPSTTTSTVPASTTTTAPPPQLAFTGSNLGMLAANGSLILGIGLSLHGLRRQLQLLHLSRGRQPNGR